MDKKLAPEYSKASPKLWIRGAVCLGLASASCLAAVSAWTGFAAVAHARPYEEAASKFAGDQGYDKGTYRAVPQEVLGWVSRIKYLNGEIRIGLRDGRHAPVEHAQVTASFVYRDRPDLTRVFDLRYQGRGRYSAPAPLPAKGSWSVYVTATQLDRRYDTVTTVEVE